MGCFFHPDLFLYKIPLDFAKLVRLKVWLGALSTPPPEQVGHKKAAKAKEVAPRIPRLDFGNDRNLPPPPTHQN